jgi:glycosyltransferase involved in cell wall biosynthesis
LRRGETALKKPVILVDGHVLDGKPQGSCAYLAGLYCALAETGAVDVKIAAYSAESLARWQVHGENIDWVPLATQSKCRRLGIEMARLQARISPDFAHFQYVTPLVKGCRWINTLHDLLFLDYPQFFPFSYRLQNAALFRLSALRSDVILTVSEYSRDALHRHFGIDKARIHVTRNALDGFFGAPDVPVEGLDAGRFIVYVSRFEPRKNQHTLVHAFADLQGALPPDFRLVLVGYPALAYPELDSALCAAGHDVKVFQEISHAQLTWLYRHAAGSIYPSRAEGFGMPVIEAVAAGGLSYCADNTAMSELTAYVHGTFDACSVEEIRAIIGRIVDGRDTAACAENQARTVAAFSWRAAAETLLRAIHV